MDADDGEKLQRIREGDAVRLERESGDSMKGSVVLVDSEGIDVVVDGTIVEGEVLAVSRCVRDDARYTAVMEVVDAAPGRSRVRLLGDWKREQMREFVRVAVWDVPVEVSGEDVAPLGRVAQPTASAGLSPRLLDVSAGGLRFESPERYRMGAQLEISFHLPGVGPLTVGGQVVRMAESRRGDSRPCQYGIRFEGLEETTRVRLMTWVFAEQARRFREKPPDD